MRGFHGRRAELARLTADLEAVRSDGRGRLVTVRGRRRVGKSWLVERFVEASRSPHVFFAASRQTPDRELSRFAGRLADSDLPSAATVPGVIFRDWEAALLQAASQADAAHPSIIVIDEFPYLLTTDRDAVEGAFQAAWDRALSRAPVLLILVGSDLAMMDSLGAYGRPLHGRMSRGVVLPPLDPGEVASLLGLRGADALDAYLVVGGFPEVARSWPSGADLSAFLSDAFGHESSPLVSTGRRILDSEFPVETQARSILSVVGAGTRTYGLISRESGIASPNLLAPLRTLVDVKRIVQARAPMSAAPSRQRRYEIDDAYLRFYLRFIEPGLADIERGRGRLAGDQVKRDWSAYRGRAIEPLVREALERSLPTERLPGAMYVGGYWTRANDLEVDLVGSDRREPPASIAFAGSIKWRGDSRVFGPRDVARLRSLAGRVPGVTAETPLVGVSRSGFGVGRGELAMSLEADDLIAAWDPTG